MMTSIALIGAGSMGSRMAKRLLDHGFEVQVCEKDLAALDRLIEAGTRGLDAPKDAANSDAVIVMVADDRQFEDVERASRLERSGGLAASCPSGKNIVHQKHVSVP